MKFPVPGDFLSWEEHFQPVAEPHVIPYAEPTFWPEIIDVYPEHKLGGLLDFDKAHLIELIRLGQDRGNAILKENPELVSVTRD